MRAVILSVVAAGSVLAAGGPGERLGTETETGVASWYGPNFHGRAAASGEIYNMEGLVAAHPTLPFNTWVRVVNLENQKSVSVRIMDRGPFVQGRIIDLSHAAAQAIGMIGPGTVPVRLEIVRPPGSDPGFFVQVGAFLNRDTAEQLRAEMAQQYGTARIVSREGDPVLYRVWVGTETGEQDARALADRIRERSGERSAFIVRSDV